nr:PREDICTED: rho guanine nucleotide exchange factor 38 isoform X2 [Equus przewalskii]
MEPKEATGKETVVTKRKNLPFLRPRLYMLERRKTDTVVESSVSGDHSGALRRSQSDRTEYNQKLQEKMTPQAGGSVAETPTQEEEHQMQRMMAKRSKIIKELIQTERDYLNDLELCVREVVQPLRSKQIDRLDVDSLFSNIESVHQISAKLLSLLEEATADVEPAMQVIGEAFLQITGPLEDVYKVYFYHHDEAHSVLESYEKEEELKGHLSLCIQSLKKIYMQEGKPNLLDMGSLMIKPIQRVMKYPLLLCELRNSTPPCHPDFRALEDAFAAVRDINVNINELKRRKDLVLKYKKNDEDESLKDKLSKLNIHSISKKSKRVTNHLKILTRGESQVKDNTFNREEKLFRSLEKAVRHCVKNISLCLQHVQDATPLALHSAMALQEVSCDKDEEERGHSEAPSKAPNPCEDFIPLLASTICEIQNRVLEEVQNLNFVKDNSATFIERKLSFEKKKPVQIPPEAPRQTDAHRSKLLSTYSTEELYQAKRRCNATQEYDINLLEGELVAVMEQKDPLGSTSRWLVDTGLMKGYVYSSFLRPYNPAKVQKVDAEHRFCDDDFDNISLFVSSRPARDSVTGTPEGSVSDSSSSLSGTCGKSEANGTDADSFQEVDEQIFYAVHAFQARSDHELSLQEYQRVHILRFCDLSGNAEWWLAEAQGQKGYVPANYLGRMTYA